MLAQVLLLCATLAGCKVHEVLWLVGDSTMAMELEELNAVATVRWAGTTLLDGELIIPIAAVGGSAVGRDSKPFVERITSARDRRIPCDRVIISLGTNDLADLPQNIETWPFVDTPEELDAALDALLAALPSVPTLWIIPDPPRIPEERRIYFRTALERARTRWPNLTLLAPKAEWLANSDGLHYNPQGQLDLAVAVEASLAPSPVPTPTPDPTPQPAPDPLP